MPGGDGTGPMGQGPKTGRAVGFCAGYPNPGYAKFGNSFNLGRGRGQGLGRRFWRQNRRVSYRNNTETFFSQLEKEDEKIYLENLFKSLKNELKEVTERLQELTKEKKE
jgi:hypothetical protein